MGYVTVKIICFFGWKTSGQDGITINMIPVIGVLTWREPQLMAILIGKMMMMMVYIYIHIDILCHELPDQLC
jgi:hypothetical protein